MNGSEFVNPCYYGVVGLKSTTEAVVKLERLPDDFELTAQQRFLSPVFVDKEFAAGLGFKYSRLTMEDDSGYLVGADNDGFIVLLDTPAEKDNFHHIKCKPALLSMICSLIHNAISAGQVSILRPGLELIQDNGHARDLLGME
jgi:hypothetical protein